MLGCARPLRLPWRKPSRGQHFLGVRFPNAPRGANLRRAVRRFTFGGIDWAVVGVSLTGRESPVVAVGRQEGLGWRG